jgi:hypothetical protein
VKGEPVDNPPESIRLFSLAENMKFAHLPVAGGLYDQHPQLLAEWEIIFEERGRYEAAKAKEEEDKAKRQQPKIKK